MPRYNNGRIPGDQLVRLDTGGGQHVTLPTPAARWYLLRRNVKARTGVTLYITAGMNAYRDWDEQGVGRRNACASGNCNAAAAQGYSSHGGTWSNGTHTGGRWVDAMAFDIGNYWAVPWYIFAEECERVGLRVGLITRAIAGIEEPWHVIDLDPYGAMPFGVQLVRGGDGVWRLDENSGSLAPTKPKEWDEVANRDEVKSASAEALREELHKRPQGDLSIIPLANSDDIDLFSLATGKRVRIQSPYHVQLIQRAQRNNDNDEMLSGELDIVATYIATVNPPPSVTVDTAEVVKALAEIRTPADAANADAVRAAITESLVANTQKIADASAETLAHRILNG